MSYATLTKAEKFFFDNAGYSWTPGAETEEQGHEQAAKQLAKAEQWACAEGMRYQWGFDGFDSSEWSDDEPACPTWQCAMFNGDICAACLGGIDIENDADPYMRVIEAQLALEAMP